MAYILPEYYTVLEEHIAEQNASFTVRLNTECAVYQGHFPEQPIAPGVCNIQMLTECVSRAVNQPLCLTHIRQCRFISLVTPQKTPFLDINIQWEKKEEHVSFTATLSCQKEGLMTMKASAKTV